MIPAKFRSLFWCAHGAVMKAIVSPTCDAQSWRGSPQEEAPSLWEQNTCNQSIPRPFHNSFHHLLSSHRSLLSAKVSTRQKNNILTQHIRWHSLSLPTLHQHALSRVHLARIVNRALDSLYRINDSLKSCLRKNENYVKNIHLTSSFAAMYQQW